MLNSISQAMPGPSSAPRRNDLPAPDAPRDSRTSGAPPTAGAPISAASYRPPAAEPATAVSRDGAEASRRPQESGFDRTYASMRGSTPAYLAALDPPAAPPPEDDPPETRDDTSRASTEKAEERKRSTEDTARLAAIDAQVRKRYDISASF